MGGRLYPFILAALTSIAPFSGVAAKTACQVQEFAELQVAPGSGSPLVAGRINGTPVLMIADTGSNYSILWRDASIRLGLKPKSLVGIQAYAIGGPVSIQEVTVHDFHLGNYSLPNRAFFVAGDRSFKPNTVGLLGADLFSTADVEFDLPEHVIRLVKPVGCRGSEVVFWNKNYSMAPLDGFDVENPRFYTNVKVNGQSISAVIDTGASVSVVTVAAASRLGITEARKESGSVRGMGPNLIPASIGRMNEFVFGDEIIKNTSIQIANINNYNQPSETGSRLGALLQPPALRLGADFFRAHRVLIAKSQNMIYFSYMGGPVFDVSTAPTTVTPPETSSNPIPPVASSPPLTK